MSDLICRKSMTRCLTPGMCSPHGGCQAPETASAFRVLLAERNTLAVLLKRFVDGEHDQDENQAERHMYHDEAQTLLAYLGGDLPGHTLVPDEALRALAVERNKAIDDCDYRADLGAYFGLSYSSWLTLPRVLMEAMPEEWKHNMAALLHRYDDTYPNQPDYGTTVRVTVDGKMVKTPGWLINYRHPDLAMINEMRAWVATPSTDSENVSRHEER
ncbi:hypothetical protein [Pseudomonas sp. ArH3a]|uniref:hypothetical protein n=1 Tax=Pseudomonas sp. ArH3a TaxID=2862945 RepID=UPI001F5A565A|nr:hypothetical protein [Pseudomonas sp. ArH3a]